MAARARRPLRGGGRRGPSPFACELRHARGGRIGSRREGEDVRGDDIAIVKQFQRVERHFLSFGGKAGDEVGADRRVGSRGLIRSTVRTASARLWRRFIRLRIMSSPACSDRWKWGISRGSPAISSNRASSISMLSSDDRRRRLRRGSAASRRWHSCPSPPSIIGDVDAGEDDFLRRGRFRGRRRRGSPRRAGTGSARAPARSSRRCSDDRSRSGPRRSSSPGAAAGRNWRHDVICCKALSLFAFPTTRRHSGHRLECARLDSAAQPVTRIGRRGAGDGRGGSPGGSGGRLRWSPRSC